MLLTLCFVKLLCFGFRKIRLVWPCQKDSRINSRYFKFGGNIRCFASKALEFLRALILPSVTQHKNKTEKLLVLQLLITCEKEESKFSSLTTAQRLV